MLSKALREFNSGPLNQLLVNLAGDDGDVWEGALKKFLRKENPWPQDLVLTDKGIEMSPSGEVVVSSRQALLTPQGTTTVTLAEEHHPGKFYMTRGGLWVSNDFLSLVVARSKKSESGKSFNLQHATLARGAIDQKIEAELSTTHLFDETDVCAVIAGLIAKQSDGEGGTLLYNGSANLFYTSSCVVGVCWDAVRRRWDVDAWLRGDGWRAGDQVFSPATET